MIWRMGFTSFLGLISGSGLNTDVWALLILSVNHVGFLTVTMPKRGIHRVPVVTSNPPSRPED